MRATPTISLTFKRILVITLMALAIGIALFAVPALPVSAVLTSLVQTTAADFNAGNFYRTGLTTKTSGGGDGNGEVRLMTVGISAAEWKSDGNVTGLSGLYGHAAVQKNGRIYVSGGGAAPSDLAGTTYVSYTTILSTTTHNLSNWTGTSSLPSARINHGMVAVGNYLYVIGGMDLSFAPQSTVYFASINSNGSLGSWTTTTALPNPRSLFAAVVVSDTIYVLGGGGVGDVPQNTIYYAKPNSDGTISGWNTNGVNLPHPLSELAATTYNGRIYIVGGFDGTIYYPDVYYTTPTSGGNITSWIPGSTTLQQNLILASGIAFGGQLYFSGGAYNNGNTLTNTVASNLLNDDGSPGPWVNSFVLSSARQVAASVVSDDGWLYIIEGNAGAGSIVPLHTIDYGPLSASGSSYAPDGTFTSSVMDIGGNHSISKIDWNTFVSSTVSMTLQYRLGTSSDLSAVAWSSPYYAAVNNSVPITNNIAINQSAQYVQYVVKLTGSGNNLHTPVLNAVAIIYDLPENPDFELNSMTAPPASSTTITQVITYTVSDKRSTASPVRAPGSQAPTGQPGGQRLPPPPPRGSQTSRAPQAPTYFYVTFYANPSPAPTGPNNLAGAMHCIDFGNPQHDYTQGESDPYIYWYFELTKVAKTFYAKCNVPGNTTSFYGQIDTCAYPTDPLCTQKGYILEFDEIGSSPSFADNIKGPLSPGQSSGGGGVFLPFIQRTP